MVFCVGDNRSAITSLLYIVGVSLYRDAIGQWRLFSGNLKLNMNTKWLKVTFLSPSWKSLNHLQGHLYNHPKKGTFAELPGKPGSFDCQISTHWPCNFPNWFTFSSGSTLLSPNFRGIFSESYNEKRRNLEMFQVVNYRVWEWDLYI